MLSQPVCTSWTWCASRQRNRHVVLQCFIHEWPCPQWSKSCSFYTPTRIINRLIVLIVSGADESHMKCDEMCINVWGRRGPRDSLPGSFGILRSSWLVQGWRCRDLPQASRGGTEERKGGDVRNHRLRGCYCHIFWIFLSSPFLSFSSPCWCCCWCCSWCCGCASWLFVVYTSLVLSPTHT